MKYVNFITLLLICGCHSYNSEAKNSLAEYYAKVDECVETEKKKPDITVDNVQIEDIKYLFLIQNIRIANCSKEQENLYINSSSYNEEKITTLSQYNSQDLSEMDKKEIEHIDSLDKSLESYNLEVDLISLYEQLKVNKE